jgi:hypothetical protein
MGAWKPLRIHGVLVAQNARHAFRIERLLHCYLAPRAILGEWFNISPADFDGAVRSIFEGAIAGRRTIVKRSSEHPELLIIEGVA